MGEQNVRFIVTEINALLGTDYNMISFDSLPRNSLIQVFSDIMTALDAISNKLDVEKYTEDSLTKILEAISNIKIPISGNLNINEFTDGIIQGKRSVIHPTLHWILSNQNEVKKRAYFAKYLKKVPVPIELMSDPEIQQLMIAYDNKIQDFKRIHLEHTKYKKMGTATLDLRKEIDRITNDMIKVNDQLEKQKPKVDKIPNKESLLVSIRAYRHEVQEEKKLKIQMEEQNVKLNELKMVVKRQEDTLENQRSLRLGPGDVVTRLRDEVNSLRIIVKERLPQELQMLRKQSDLMAKVVSEPEPTQSELDDLQTEVDNASFDLQKVMETTLVSTDPKDDKLAQFRQHVTVIANNKQMAADSVLELRDEVNIMKRKVEEREQMLTNAIGGKMPQGDELKKYVSQLRARSIIYKERRSQLQEMQAELGVLTRTLDILKQENFHLIEALQSKDIDTENQSQYYQNMPDDLKELISTCKELVKQVNSNKTEITMARQELQTLKADIEVLSKKHERAKEIYESSVSNFSEEIKKLENEIKDLEDSISFEEDKWKEITKDTEGKEDILQRLAEDEEYGNEGRRTQIDILNDKLNEQKDIHNQLIEEMKKVKSEKEEREQQVIMWHSTLELLKCKKQANKDL